MRKPYLLLALSLFSSLSAAQIPEQTQTAKYIGNLRWKLDNGLIIYRHLEIENDYGFAELGWASTLVISDRLKLEQAWAQEHFYRVYYHDSSVFELCGKSRGAFDQIHNVSDDLAHGVVLRGSKGIKTFGCASDDKIYVEFETPVQMERDVAAVEWQALKPIYLHNLTLLLGAIVAMMMFVTLTTPTLNLLRKALSRSA
uniref:hypothetical protein n=1 Tax=Thaumasiovibrio occultus TaxID=1891184 RepID=UPI000B34C749|nr:hypothetical protein [Thaumasiovibrio occultus]